MVSTGVTLTPCPLTQVKVQGFDEIGDKEEHNHHQEHSGGAKEEVLVCDGVLGLQLRQSPPPQFRGGEDTGGRGGEGRGRERGG